MRIPRILLLATLLAGCGGGAAGPRDPAAIAAAARSGAGFRYVAAQVYRALRTESCRRDPALLRATVLAPEQAAMRRFEEQAGAGPAGHLGMVRADIEYARASGTLGCWADSDPDFARKHVDMARESAQQGLARLKSLAPGVAALPDTSESARSRLAAFRALVRTLAQSLDPPCAVTAAASNDMVLEPARAEAALLRRRLESTPAWPDFTVAEADTQFEQRQTIVECVEPGETPDADARRTALVEARGQIARIEAAARAAGS